MIALVHKFNFEKKYVFLAAVALAAGTGIFVFSDSASLTSVVGGTSLCLFLWAALHIFLLSVAEPETIFCMSLVCIGIVMMTVAAAFFDSTSDALFLSIFFGAMIGGTGLIFAPIASFLARY